MRKIAIIVLLLLTGASLSSAADFDVRRYGAKGNGVRMDTKAIQKAIDACSKAGGGRVVLADGTFLTGPLKLKDGVDFHIEESARLLASPNIEDFQDWKDVKHVRSENLPRGNRNACLIFADEARRIAITGAGTIDCNGQFHVRKSETPQKRWTYERIYATQESLPRVIFLTGCKDILLEDVMLVNQPAGWGYWIHDCDSVTIRRLRIFSDLAYPNNDGIHLNCSRDVTVTGCHIETGDDAIVLRANSRSLAEPKPMERALISDCELRSNASGIRIAWTGDGVIRDCSLSNITIRDSYLGISIHVPNRAEGQLDYGEEATRIENLHFSNIVMDGIYSYPILAVMGDDRQMRIDAIQDISFTNMTVTARRYPQFKGREETPFRRFTFKNCTFTKTYETHHPEFFVHTSGFVYDSCTFGMDIK